MLGRHESNKPQTVGSLVALPDTASATIQDRLQTQIDTCLTHLISFSLADTHISEYTITKSSTNKRYEQNSIWSATKGEQGKSFYKGARRNILIKKDNRIHF